MAEEHDVQRTAPAVLKRAFQVFDHPAAAVRHTAVEKRGLFTAVYQQRLAAVARRHALYVRRKIESVEIIPEHIEYLVVYYDVLLISCFICHDRGSLHVVVRIVAGLAVLR